MSSDLIIKGYKDRRVLVTGHTGFKGSWLCEMLLEAGAYVGGFALAPCEPSLYSLLELDARMQSFYGDIRDRKKLERVFREAAPEIVIHLAAQAIVRRSYEEPAYTYEVNMMGTVNVLEAARKTASVRSVIVVTTDKVYRNDGSGRAFSESDALCGSDPYSNSKSCAELAVESWRQSFLDRKSIAVSTVRTGNVIGGGDFGRDRIIPDCVRAVLKHQPVVIRNPRSLRPYQHVTAPLLAYLRLALLQMERPETAGAFNIGPSESMETLQLVKLFCDKWNAGMPAHRADYVIRPDDGPAEAAYLRLDTGKAGRSGLAGQPLSIEEAMEEVTGFVSCRLSGDDIGAHVRDWIRKAAGV